MKTSVGSKFMTVVSLLQCPCLLILLGTAASAVESKHRPQIAIYDKAVNETLDTTLEVGAEWRGQRRRFTWNELQLEVARRLRVQRKEPWNR